jgi:non-ribosomal peptide synthetase component E (peptide arylation enzyme)
VVHSITVWRALTAWLAYKTPSVVVMVDAFPLNAMGKVQKAALLERVLADRS